VTLAHNVRSPAEVDEVIDQNPRWTLNPDGSVSLP
jgi:hypothetical protein